MRQLNIVRNFDDLDTVKACSFLNFASLGSYFENKEFDDIEYYCDGMLAACLFSMLSNKKIKRVSFDNTSIAPKVFSQAAMMNKKICIIGATEEQALLFKAKLDIKYPDIQVDLIYDGYFTNEKFLEILTNLKRKNIELVVLGLGAGKQEKVLLKIISEFPAMSVFTCGGFIRQESESLGEYYPKWVNFLNVRFFYRMIKEPHTIKRYIINYPINILKLLFFIFKKKIRVNVQ